MSLAPTLYRELLRTTRRLASLTNEYNAHRVAHALNRLELRTIGASELAKTYSAKQWHQPLPPSGPHSDWYYTMPSKLVRKSFRYNDDVLHEAIDDAFTALRTGNELIDWLQVNYRLHGLRQAEADCVSGACEISDVLHRRGSPAAPSSASCADHVASELDGIAAAVRDLSDGGDKDSIVGRLRIIQRINAVMFDRLGFRGEYGDIEASSSLVESLARRRGLPITLSILYAGVGTRLGLPVAVTNFPSHVLLRLEASNDGGEQNTAAADASSLAGLYTASYGSHGPEVIEVRHTNGALTATKVTGDNHVPAGEWSWRADLPSSSILEPGATLDAKVQIAEAGFTNPREIGGTLKVGDDSSSLVLDMEDDSLVFKRCDADATWYIDPFARGQLLPPDACKTILGRAGLPPEEHAKRLEAVPPAMVWARMCRNLTIFSRREGKEEAARFWEGAETGLDEAAAP